MPFAGRPPGKWVVCGCGERFVLTSPSARPEPARNPADRVVEFFVYGLGGAVLVLIPVAVLTSLTVWQVDASSLFTAVTAGIFGTATVIGFLVGGLFGERGVNAIGRCLRRLRV
jgi:hypothetical protein